MFQPIKSTFLTVLLFLTLFSFHFSYSGNKEENFYKSFYNKLNTPDISYIAFINGVKGYNKICDSLKTKFNYLCIADFEKPSTEKRFYIINMTDTSVYHIDYVAHGKNSGVLYAESFSNLPQSNQSSLGFYLVAEPYIGKHGYSLRLDGIEKGFNDNARKRAVVMHAAEYAEPEFINQTGRLGRSQGCPAMPSEGFKKVASTIKEKSLLFIYYPNATYVTSSVWLKNIDQTNLANIK